MKKIVFSIIDMNCSSCSITIDGTLEDMNGVHSARTHYAKAQTEIAFDPTQVTEQQLAAIIKKSGYTVKTLAKVV